MKVTILVFSPSGNTTNTAAELQQKLQHKGAEVTLCCINGAEDIFSAQHHTRFFREHIPEHDVLCIGGPVYAHHLQFHMLDLLKALPEPGNGWGSHAFPFVTYGGISSGIALEEAGALLKQSGRIVLAGMKITAKHHFFKRAFGIDHSMPNADTDAVIEDAARRIMAAGSGGPVQDQAVALKYQPRELAQKANTIFIEKEWHAARYPQITLDTGACNNCGKCVKHCPVGHLVKDASGCTIQVESSPCIHCFNCLAACPAGSISMAVEPEKAAQGKAFISQMLKNTAEHPEKPASAVYPIL